MEGPWGSLDPDVVDQETGNFWRGLYKLEKQFNEVPKAQSIAVKVSTPSSYRCTQHCSILFSRTLPCSNQR